MFNLVLAHVNNFQDIYAIENRLDFVFIDDKSLQRRRKFVGERDFRSRGGTWIFSGWVCAARDSKLAPRSKKKFL